MTKSQLSLRVYDSAQAFLDDNSSSLSLHEVQNIFMLLSAQQAAKEGLPFYGNAVWDLAENQLALALVWFNNSMLYASHVPESLCQSAMTLALEDLASNQPTIRTDLSFMHAFQPALSYLESHYGSITDMPLEFKDYVWSHTLYRQKPTLTLPDVPSRCELRLATEDLVNDYLVPWLEAFIKETGARESAPAIQLIQQSMQNKFVYVLYDPQGVPVSMACKRRPTLSGCSIAFVYTPPAYRGHQYASLCVGLLSELLLKEFEYVTLFVMHVRDPYKNLYTDIGYQFTGEAGRLVSSVNINK